MLVKKNFMHLKVLVIVLLISPGCNITTISTHNKQEQQHAKPSIHLIESIIEFRETYKEWPQSKEEFISRNLKYKESFNDFPYLYTRFKITDQDKMTFYFDQHRDDVKNYETNKKVDLNALAGEVKFYKSNEKFVWSIKMY
jgi:hypothetical protein